MAATGSSDARKRWELENDVHVVSEADGLFRYDKHEQQAIQQQRPWTRNPHHFQHVRISALALLKMAMHAKSGGNLEIMGLLQGKLAGDTFIVLDAYALPVEGTETRVSAQSEANEYMVDFGETSKVVGRLENVVGWYHSHPGYGCWLSGIDCSTQSINQKFSDPFLAVVIDPHRTIAAGKVDIGAFRTYPEGYKPPDASPSEYQTIPMNKIEDFGVHASQYYSLEVSYFKSSIDSHMLDQLWSKHWVSTLGSSPLISTRELASDQLTDIAAKLEVACGEIANSGRLGRYLGTGKMAEEGKLSKISRDISSLAAEQMKGVSSQVIKSALFDLRPLNTAPINQELASTQPIDSADRTVVMMES